MYFLAVFPSLIPFLRYVLDLTWTLLLPMAAVAMAMITVKAVRHVFAKEGTAVRSSHGGDDDVMATPPGDLAVQTYHLLQTAAYAVMATLIMRLKLFLSPQLAVVAGLLPSLLTGSRLSVSHVCYICKEVMSVLAEVKVQVGGCWTTGVQFTERMPQFPSAACEL